MEPLTGNPQLAKLLTRDATFTVTYSNESNIPTYVHHIFIFKPLCGIRGTGVIAVTEYMDR